jgi:hypothetical protein
MPYYVQEDGTVIELDDGLSTMYDAGADLGIGPTMGPYDSQEDAGAARRQMFDIDIPGRPDSLLENPVSIMALGIIATLLLCKILRRIS